MNALNMGPTSKPLRRGGRGRGGEKRRERPQPDFLATPLPLRPSATGKFFYVAHGLEKIVLDSEASLKAVRKHMTEVEMTLHKN